jgi:hypothetical protein
MAIETDYITERGILFPKQYLRVDEVYALKNEMTITVGVYMNQEQAVNGVPAHAADRVFGSYDMYSNQNLWEQAYALIKQRWPNAIDIV